VTVLLIRDEGGVSTWDEGDTNNIAALSQPSSADIKRQLLPIDWLCCSPGKFKKILK